MEFTKWQQRVIDEAEELSLRIEKLEDLLYSNNEQIPKEEKVLLVRQLSLMGLYHETLMDRILKFQGLNDAQD